MLLTTAHYADISEATIREVFDRVNGRDLGQNWSHAPCRNPV